MNWNMNFDSEIKEPIFNQEETGVLIDLGATKATNELVLPMASFILKHAPINIVIQKEANSSGATVYISTADRYNFLIKNGYGMGYVGTGSRGLETLLETLNINENDIQMIFDSSIKFVQFEFK
ncbi:hypothetical protein P7H42_05890 [Vagococcus lutrae]|uniref:Uncharacterized protein n=1 Tax=Enterococcus xiangfangensis TaxID=1296537 RepID=A0ABU3FDA0_9ENTE|nr:MULTISPECIES: hypothetical protein [Enterococcaceae]MDT2760651.1 hypothetical protein [Enterococcus xiangfangensis]MDT2819297.1 hypothetical protein [Vagococcus lutrae]MDT2832058.1 hypothetical protein [Vagococcus carniphilus]